MTFPGDDSLTAEDWRRWSGGLLIAGALHAVVAGGVVWWLAQNPELPAAETAMLIDLAPPEPTPPAPEPAPEPEPALPEPPLPEPLPPEPPPPEPAPPEPPPPTPPAPEPVPPEPTPPDVPPPEPPPVVEKAAVVAPPPPVKVNAKPVEKKPLPKAVKSPPPQPTAAPPTAAPAAPVAPHVLPSWQAQVMAHLERRKRYPRAAQLHREGGIAKVRFVIDRTGAVLSFRLESSSGVPALDEEVLSLIERASPLPAPPPEIARDRMEMVAPVRFDIR